MKIILSRKGFDTQTGGYPSPVFPDNTMFSIPIPNKSNRETYKNLNFKHNNIPISKILNDLTKKRIRNKDKKRLEPFDYYTESKFRCHYDPQIIENHFTLGQAHNALSHLNKQNVGKGDVFVFYGLFRKVEFNQKNNKWKYKDKPFHCIFGYMKVKDIIEIKNKQFNIEKYPFSKNHPHLQPDFLNEFPESKIYIGSTFEYFKFDKKRVLTDMDNYKNVSKWKLPINFDFTEYITYIQKMEVKNNSCYIQHTGYGQEFVISTEKIPSPQKEKLLNYFANTLDIEDKGFFEK